MAILTLPSIGLCSALVAAALGLGRGDPLPPFEPAVGAYLAARSWVDGLACPPEDDPAARVEVPGCRGIAVTLRHEGRVVGFGDDFAGDPDVVDPDGLMLRRAVARALGRARGDRVVSSLPADLRGTIGDRLALEIEFAGEPAPLLGRTFAEAASRMEPGLDGLALRRGRAFFAAFPSRTLATGLAGSPERTLRTLAGDAGFPAGRDLPELVAIEPVGLYRFRTLRLGQRSAGESPVEFHRSGRRIDAAEVTRERLSRLVSDLLARVGRTLPSKDGGSPDTMLAKGLALGDYRPVADEYRPLVATTLDQAMLVFALAEVASNPAVAASDRASARNLALGLLAALGRIPKESDDPLRAVNAAPLLVLAADLLADVEGEPARELVARARTACVAPDAMGDPALLAAAIAALAEGNLIEAEVANAALARAWAAAPGERQVGAFPWLVLAESTAARTARRVPARGGEFQALAGLVLAAQVRTDDPSFPADLTGGIRLGGPRTPVSAQSFRPSLGLAWLSAKAIPAGLPIGTSELGRIAEGNRAAARFLLQLSVDEADARIFRNPARTRGGIRAAAWESEQPVSVQAFGLLLASALLATEAAADR